MIKPNQFFWLKNTRQLNIHRKVKIKQHTEVKYLGYIFNCNLLGETMALKVLNKINSGLKFLYRKQNVLNFPLKRLLCNALIQRHFEYASQLRYPNLTKALSKKLFIPNITKNWLPTNERVNQHMYVCVRITSSLMHPYYIYVRHIYFN